MWAMFIPDHLGATGAGMQAMLMDVGGAYRDKGVARVESLEKLAYGAAGIGKAAYCTSIT